MHRFLDLIARSLDRVIAGHGMGLFYRPEWATARLDAWHDTVDGSFTVQAWRFELEIDRAPRWLCGPLARR